MIKQLGVDKTQYARNIGYTGDKPVRVFDGKVISHRSIEWFDFCAALRRKRCKIPDSFYVLVRHGNCFDGAHHSILLRESSVERTEKAFSEYMKRPAQARSFTEKNQIELHGPCGLISKIQH